MNKNKQTNKQTTVSLNSIQNRLYVVFLLFQVNSVNGNPPIWSPVPSNVTIQETATTGALIQKVQATDSDSGADGVVTFRLLSAIDSKSLNIRFCSAS